MFLISEVSLYEWAAIPALNPNLARGGRLQKGNKSKEFEGFHLKAKAIIWPWLSLMPWSLDVGTEETPPPPVESTGSMAPMPRQWLQCQANGSNVCRVGTARCVQEISSLAARHPPRPWLNPVWVSGL
jgi:hypothetical protein